MPSRWRGPVSSRFCGHRRGATCGRRRTRPGSSAAMAAARPTTRPPSPRRSRRGPNGRGYSAIRLLRIIASMTPWRRRPKPSASCSSACGRPRWPAPWRVAKPTRASSCSRRGTSMTLLGSEHKLDGEVRPLVMNVMNFAKAGDGEPTLLSFDDARTVFHEFGHGLHGLMSDVTYPMIACTRVATDFVELPSQLYEHWLEQPEVLRRFARHYRTGEPRPEDLLRRLLAARTFAQGFATPEN